MTISLCMIVKNEAHVIERALASVKDKIDYWVIIDTGSTDGTQDVVARAMDGVPGLLLARPWKNFATNRTEALDFCRGRAAHALVLDADDVIEGEFPDLDPNVSYSLPVRHGNLSHHRPHLLATAWGWRYEGAVHEAAVCHALTEHKVVPLAAPLYRVVGGGARSLRGAEKFMDDVALLRAELEKTPDHARSMFYLAQSYRDAGRLAAAADWYRARANMGGWAEEAYQAAYEAAKLEPSIEAFWRAWEMRPTRAEPLVAGAAWARSQGRHHLSLAMLKAAPRNAPEEDVLFVEPDAYGWRYADERAVAEYWAGDPNDGLNWADAAILHDPPTEHLLRMKQNVRHAEVRMRGAA